MHSQMTKKRAVTPFTKTPYNTSEEYTTECCRNDKVSSSTWCCFFCIMKEPDTFLRRASVSNYLKQMSLIDNEEHVLVLSTLWHIAMTEPNDPEFPSLGIFTCLSNLLHKATTDTNWLLTNQNMYIPYYAAHIIGSYTIHNESFAQLAVESGVIPLLLDLLNRKISWIEQRVAVRALGHLASYETTFQSAAEYEQEIAKFAMNLASTCLEKVYVEFVIKDENKRMEYHRNLLTRGVGDLEMENRKAEEWASQLQCWSLYLLNCFACKKNNSFTLNLICKTPSFLEDLCDMWGGLVNHTSSGGVGLIRLLCYSKIGRKSIAESLKVLNFLGNISRSCDDWQYMGIDCLVLLLKDPDTRYKVFDVAVFYLVDLVELKSLGDKSNVGETITKVLLLENGHGKLHQVVDLKVERKKKEKPMSNEKLEEMRVLVNLLKQQGNHMFRLGKMEEALLKYCEGLEICPLRFRKERMVLYSNKAQCHLMLRDPDSAISDSTRALCLSNPVNSHGKSLWRRSQAYDMKGMAKESLMDCLMVMNGCVKMEEKKRGKIPYHAARMISKQMDATWLFATARSKVTALAHKSVVADEELDDHKVMMKKKTSPMSGLSTIIEEPFHGKEEIRRKMKRERRRILKKAVVAREVV